jgi:hypothetical protein
VPFPLFLKLASKLTSFIISLRKALLGNQSLLRVGIIEMQKGGPQALQASVEIVPYQWEHHYPPELTRVNHEEKTHPLACSLPGE